MSCWPEICKFAKPWDWDHQKLEKRRIQSRIVVITRQDELTLADENENFGI